MSIKAAAEIRKKIRNSEVEALFVSSEANVRYLSGFTGAESYLMICDGGQYIITDGRYTEQAAEQCPDYEIINWDNDNPYQKKAVKLAADNQVHKLGFEKESLTYKKYEKIKSEAQKEEITLIPEEGLVEELRYTKSESEIAKIKKAAELADRAFSSFLDFIKPGLTEREAALELEYLLRKLGAEGIGSIIILVSGTRTSLPHGEPSDKQIEQGDLITLDFGGKYQGYVSDMTRTFVLGQADQKQKKIYRAVREAQKTGLEVLTSGLSGKKADSEVRKVLDKYDLEDRFAHGLGHGLGLEIHEKPFMGPKCSEQLKEGCVVTVEPGVYIPGWGGVRIEDTVVIGKKGAARLTESKKELLEI